MKNCTIFKKILPSLLGLVMFLCPCSIVSAQKPDIFSSPLPHLTVYGGSFDEIRRQSYDHQKFEVHHLLSRSALNLFSKYYFSIYDRSPQSSFLEDSKQGWAPSILLTKEDHLKTLSRSRPGYDFSMVYISDQALQMIQYGAFLEMLKNEIAFIQKYINVDGKYDEGVRQVCNYIKAMNIRTYKNKLSFSPLAGDSKSPKFSYVIPKHSIWDIPILHDSYLGQAQTLDDSSVQTEEPAVIETSTQTDPPH